MPNLFQGTAAALLLSVPALAVWAFTPSYGAPLTVAIAPGDDPVVDRLSTVQEAPAAPTRTTDAGEAPAEVLTQDWVFTSTPARRPKPSPKG
jgi:hypothetical protein